ncbi:MAG: hypothetical protein P8049_07400, partial [Gemmatimonadota bacterium]
MLDLLPPNWLPALAVFLTVGLGVISIAFLIESGRELKRRRDFRRQLEGVAKGSTDGRGESGSIIREIGNGEVVLRETFEPVLEAIAKAAVQENLA